MTEMESAGTLGDLLASRRQRRFVGRASEVELFRVALDSPEPPFVLLHIYGPPGIGKTSLLDVYAGLAADAGASVVRLDGRELVPSPSAVLQALGEVLEVPEGERAIVGPSDAGRVVVLCDTYERLAPRWMPGYALGCCRACRRPPSRSSPDGRHQVWPGAPTRPGGSCCGWCRCATSARKTAAST